jgi:hypothetical protein
MKQAISVIATALMDGRLKFETSEAQAADILDRMNAAGFQIMEPSDKVFNSPDPLRDQFAGQAMASLLWDGDRRLTLMKLAQDSGQSVQGYIAESAYLQADAMMKEREKKNGTI